MLGDSSVTPNDSVSVVTSDQNSVAESQTRSRTGSTVWEDFQKIAGGKKRCKHCGSEFSGGTGTGTLAKHIKNHCQRYRPTQKTIISAFQNGSKVIPAFSQLRSRGLLVDWIVQGQHSFSIIEEPAFRVLMESANHKMQLFSADTVRRDVMKRFLQRKAKIKDYLKTITSRCSFTTDIWTSMQQVSYMAITLHFLDEDFNINAMLIGFGHLPSPHTGVCIAAGLVKAFEDYDVDSQIIAGTLDNASNNDAAMRAIANKIAIDGPSLIRNPCFAHVLNLAAQDGLRCIKDITSSIRKVVSQVRNSPKRRQELHEACTIVRIDYLTPTLDVPTRWNSTFAMLRTAIDLKKGLEYMVNGDRTLSDLPTEDQWDEIIEVVKLLRPLNDATRHMSGSRYATICMVAPTYLILKHYFQLYERNDPNAKFRSASQSIVVKLQKYWEPNQSFYMMVHVLDPRRKLVFLRDRLNSFGLSTSEVERQSECVYQDLQHLYDLHYAPTTPDNSTPPTSRPVPASIESLVDDTTDDIFGAAFLRIQSVGSLQTHTSEVEAYVNSPVVNENVDILNWWKSTREIYPNLARMARDLLSIPCTSVPSEQAFSASSELITKRRNALRPESVEACMLQQSWIPILQRVNSDIVTEGYNSEESCEELETLLFP